MIEQVKVASKLFQIEHEQRTVVIHNVFLPSTNISITYL